MEYPPAKSVGLVRIKLPKRQRAFPEFPNRPYGFAGTAADDQSP